MERPNELSFSVRTSGEHVVASQVFEQHSAAVSHGEAGGGGVLGDMLVLEGEELDSRLQVSGGSALCTGLPRCRFWGKSGTLARVALAQGFARQPRTLGFPI